MTILPTVRLRHAALLAACAVALGGCGVSEGATVGSGATLARGASGPPTLALASNGKTAYVAWLQKGDGGSDVLLEAVTPNGRRLRAPVRVNATPGDASTHEQAPPQVAVGPGGEVYVVWQKSTEVRGRMYPVSDLRFAYSTDGGRTFSPTMTVNDDAGARPSSHSFHNVTVAPDGTVYVAWLDGRAQDAARAAHPAHGHGAGGVGAEIRVASWRPGDASFGPSARVDGDVCPCCRTSLAVGPDGAVYVAWRKVYPGEVREVVVARSADGGRTFSAPVRVQRDGWVFPGCPHAGPSIAVDGRGRLFATWYSGKAGGQGLYYAVSSDGGRSFGSPVALVTGDFVPASQARLAAGADGVWAAWDDMRGKEKQIRVGRLDGTSVREVGDPTAGSTPSIRMSGETGAVTWHEGQAVRIRAITSAG